MKLTRSEFQNYIHAYEPDEIFYRDLYFAEKDHPETFREYCQGLDKELIASHNLYVPVLFNEAWFPYVEESDVFKNFNGNIMLRAGIILRKEHVFSIHDMNLNKPTGQTKNCFQAIC